MKFVEKDILDNVNPYPKNITPCKYLMCTLKGVYINLGDHILIKGVENIKILLV